MSEAGGTVEGSARGRQAERSDPVAALVAAVTSVPWLVALGSIVVVLPLLVRRVGDPDYFWHLATARWMVEHHALPSHDLFTYTVTAHTWTDHEYLSELLIDGLTRIGGTALVSLGFGAITCAGFVLMAMRMRLRPTAPAAIAPALLLAALTGNLVWGPRTQMITFAFVCLELLLIERFLDDRGRAILALPLIVAVWSNFHSGFVICFGFLGLAVLLELGRMALGGGAQARRRALVLAGVTLASAVGGLVNPHGAGIYSYAVRTQTDTVQQSFIREWQAPNFHDLNVRPFELMVLLLLIGLALRRGARAWDVLLSVAALVLALQSVRHIALFVAAATPVLAWTATDLLGRATDASPRLRSMLERWRQLPRRAAALGAGVVLIAAVGITGQQLSRQRASTNANFPVAAAGWLDDHPTVGTRMLNDYAFGGYLANRFFPDPNRRVFLFGEADLMGDALIRDYADMVGVQSDWRRLLAHYRVDYALLTPDTPLASALAADPAWQLAYSDPVAVILVKRTS